MYDAKFRIKNFATHTLHIQQQTISFCELYIDQSFHITVKDLEMQVNLRDLKKRIVFRKHFFRNCSKNIDRYDEISVQNALEIELWKQRKGFAY